MSTIVNILSTMRENPGGTTFASLQKVCEHFFGPPRVTRGSHRIYRTPWAGDPRINIQNDRGKAKAYQVRQVLRAIDKLNSGESDEK